MQKTNPDNVRLPEQSNPSYNEKLDTIVKVLNKLMTYESKYKPVGNTVFSSNNPEQAEETYKNFLEEIPDLKKDDFYKIIKEICINGGSYHFREAIKDDTIIDKHVLDLINSKNGSNSALSKKLETVKLLKLINEISHS